MSAPPGWRRTVYQLSESERDDITALAEARNANKRQKRRGDDRYMAKASDLIAHRQGAAAEYVVARLLDVPMNREISPAGNKRGYDLWTPWGTVEVKYRRRRGWLYALDSVDVEEFRADYGVLVWPEWGDVPDTYWVFGYITRYKFQCRSMEWAFPYRREDGSRGEYVRRVVQNNELEPFYILQDWIALQRKLTIAGHL